MVKGWDSVRNRKACDKFLDGSTWKKICNDKYYNEVLIRYKGKLVEEGEPYTVFSIVNSQKVDLMVFFLIDEVRDCNLLKVTSMNEFQCMNKMGQKLKDITTKQSLLACLPYRFHLAEELYYHCVSEEALEEMPQSTNMSDENNSTILYYANISNRLNELRSVTYSRLNEAEDFDGEPGDKASLCSTSLIILIISALLVIFLCHRI